MVTKVEITLSASTNPVFGINQDTTRETIYQVLTDKGYERIKEIPSYISTSGEEKYKNNNLIITVGLTKRFELEDDLFYAYKITAELEDGIDIIILID